MKFFIPAAKDKEDEEGVYNAIKRLHSEPSSDSHYPKEFWPEFDDRRIFKLRYTHEGEEYLAEVGKPHALNGEVVVAILYEPMRQLYYVCTANRGVLRGDPIHVGESSVLWYEDFE